MIASRPLASAVSDNGRGRTREAADEPRRVNVPPPARAGLDVVLEVRVALRERRDAIGRGGGEGSPAKIRVDHDAGRVDDAPERGRLFSLEAFRDPRLDGRRRVVDDVAGAEAPADRVRLGAKRVDDRRVPVSRLERAQRVALPQLLDRWNGIHRAFRDIISFSTP
jgi:hypothetical protein